MDTEVGHDYIAPAEAKKKQERSLVAFLARDTHGDAVSQSSGA
jgi:hypothetical protein